MKICLPSFLQDKVDLFAQSAYSGPSSSLTVDLFAASDPPFPAVNKTVETEPTNPNVIDPFANMPLNNFETSDVFGDFTSSHTNPVSTQSTQNSSHNGVSLNQNTTEKSMPPQKKETFQVKSGIWADTLSRGLIDLNISARKFIFLILWRYFVMICFFCIHKYCLLLIGTVERECLNVANSLRTCSIARICLKPLAFRS